MSMSKLKEAQLAVILKHNPMRDDYHVGIRKLSDIKTFAEVVNDDESFVYGDFSRQDALNALKTGKITVYSSKGINVFCKLIFPVFAHSVCSSLSGNFMVDFSSANS